MKVYSELIKAQLENSAADPTSTVVGLINYQTTEHRVKFATGSIVTAVLANDQYCVFGTSVTASQNIRFNRAAAGVLQFVTADDSTAEGSLSTALAQLSFKVEGYATGSLPAAGRAGRLLFDSTLTTLKLDTGVALVPIADYSYLASMNMTGFISWGGSGNYYSASTLRFTVLRSGTGRIKNSPITWAGNEYVDLTANKGYFIGYSATNTLAAIDYASIVSADKYVFHENFEAMFRDYVILFSVWTDAAGISWVCKNNHPYEYMSNIAAHDHFRLGSVFLFSGALISVLSAANRTIQSAGADLIDDHGVSTAVPDSTGAALSIVGIWKNGSSLAQRYHRRKFTVSGVTVTPTAGATYTNNGSTFTVLYSSIVAGSGTIETWRSAGTADPETSGNLTKASGTGDATIAFSAWTYNRVVPAAYNNSGTPTPLGTSGATRYAVYAIFATPNDLQTPTTAAPVPGFFALLPNATYSTSGAAIASLGTSSSPDLTQFTMPQEFEVIEPVLLGFVIVDGNDRQIEAVTSGGFTAGVKSFKTTPTTSTTSGAVAVTAAVNVLTDVSAFGDALTSSEVNVQLALDKLDDVCVTKTGTHALTNKDYDGGTASDTSRVTLGKNTTTNLNGLTKKEATLVYDTTTKKVKVGDGSTWLTVGSSGGGSAINWRFDYAVSPVENNSAGVPTLDFPYEDTAGVYCLLTVPNDYVAGTQILLKNGKFATTATTNKVKFKATTYLIESGTTVLGTYSNSHASTNAEVTADGDASTVTDIGDIDCTDASGQVNGQAVAGGDIILILFIRDTAGESTSAAADARFLRDSLTPFFG